MNYNALLLLDKHRNHKTSFSLNSSGINQFSFLKHKTSYNINTHIKDNTKYKKCYSVKPYSYSMPKDIILKDIFNNSINYSNEFIKKYDLININNIYNNTSEDRKYIFDKIKKFILINHINYNILGKTIFLYDLLLFEKQKQNGKNKKFNIMNSVPNLLIAIIAFILILKFNKENNKIISLKQFMKKFEEKDENISLNEIYEIEILALQLIDYNLTFRTPFSFMELFLLNGIVFNEDYISSDLSLNIYELANETLENIMMNSNEYFKCNYCYLCCSVIMYVREKFKINGWPKALEINFDMKYQQFSDIYNFFFLKNKNNNYYSNDKNKNNIKRFYNCDIINISNLKSMSNIINVLKIMKSADKYKKNKDKINKIDLFNNKNDKEEVCKDNINNNKNISTLDKIKIEQNKNNNCNFFKSPDNLTIVKPSISNILTNLNKENRLTIFNINNDNNINAHKKAENSKNSDKEIQNAQNKEKIPIKNKYNNSTNVEQIRNDESINTLKKSNIFATKSFNRYRKTFNKNKKYSQANSNYNSNQNSYINNDSIINCNTDGYYSNNIINQNFYKNTIKKANKSLNNYCDKNRELKNQLINRNINRNININSYNITIKNHNHNNNIIKNNNRYYYSEYTEKKVNYELSNDSKKTTFNLNQTSLNDYLYHKNKNNKNKDKDIENENYFNNYKIKNKDENSNAPTCESSNIKLSSNDFSIRKSYRLKKKFTQNEIKTEKPKNEKIKKYEKEGKKVLEKNKSYNKLLNAKISFSDKTYNRKTGLRNFYKQKNLLEHHQ